MIWRREAREDAWHFCANCPKWPKAGDYEEVQRLPFAGQMCQECKGKKDKGECHVEARQAKP